MARLCLISLGLLSLLVPRPTHGSASESDVSDASQRGPSGGLSASHRLHQEEHGELHYSRQREMNEGVQREFESPIFRAFTAQDNNTLGKYNGKDIRRQYAKENNTNNAQYSREILDKSISDRYTDITEIVAYPKLIKNIKSDHSKANVNSSVNSRGNPDNSKNAAPSQEDWNEIGREEASSSRHNLATKSSLYEIQDYIPLEGEEKKAIGLKIPNAVHYSRHQYNSFGTESQRPKITQIDPPSFSHYLSQSSSQGENYQNFNLPVLKSQSGVNSHHYPPRFGPPTSTPLPSFDSTPTNTSAQHGSNTFLLCRIRNLANQSVSWIRSRDSHIISVDRMTFIADERFHVFHDSKTGSWNLQIKFVQARDDGTYECQVSSEPKISHFVHFKVVTPLVKITGGPEIHVQNGDPVKLKCVISATLHLPTYVFWFQDGERVAEEEGYFGNRDRKVTVERVSSNAMVTTLFIPRVSVEDAGIYTCSPDSLPTDAITVHVINGEHPAAMQHGSSITSFRTSKEVVLTLLIVGWLCSSLLLRTSREPHKTFNPGQKRSAAVTSTKILPNFFDRVLLALYCNEHDKIKPKSQNVNSISKGPLQVF